MGIRQFADGLINALTGMGGTRDPRSYNAYAFCKLHDQQIDAAFRSSWAMRKIITKPAADMTREWRDWQTDKANIEKLEAEEKRLDVRGKFERAEVLRGLGGAGMVIYIEGDNQMSPIDPARVKAEGIAALHVWHKSCFTLGEPIAAWNDAWFGHPSHYEIRLAGTAQQQAQKFHPSRVIAFRGEQIGGMAFGSWIDAWWGDSIVDVVKEAVDNVHTGENGFAALIKDARLRRISVPKLFEKVATAGGESLMSKRMEAFALGENSQGVTWLDGGDSEGKGAESIDDRQMVWAGIPDIKASNLAVAAAAARMPATVLLGKSPDGMNSTGKGDQTLWDQEVQGRQDLRMRPCVEQLDAALIPSALGKPDASVWWEFAPLTTPTEAEEATTFNTSMDAVTKLQASALVPDIALSKAVQNFMVERGYLPGLDDALAEVPEGERFPSEIAEEAPESVNGGKEVDPTSAGGGRAPAPARRAANDARFADATPRTLYVRRDVVNVAEIRAWAKAQGLPELQDGLHCTIIYSRQPVDWMKIDGEWNADDKGQVTIAPGGVRIVEPLGDRTAVLLFTSSALSWRHESIVRAGAEHGYADYQPHISLTGEPVDLTGVEPYRGKIVLGPEIFEELRTEGGQQGDRPFDDSYRPGQPRDRNGRWAKSGSTRDFIKHAATSSEPRRARVIGQVNDSTAALLSKLGHDAKGKSVVLDHSYTRHILIGHGTAAERARGQIPVTRTDLARVHHLLNGPASFRAGVPAIGKQGHPRFEATVKRGRSTFTIIGETRKRTVVVLNMWKK